MLTRFGLAAFALAISSVPASAAGTQIVFVPNTMTQPSYSTAALVQAFSSPQADETGFVPNLSNASGTSETTTGNANTARILDTHMVGTYLVLRSANYVLSFDSVGQFAAGVKYVSFLIGNYNFPNDSVTLHFKDGTHTENILKNLLGLDENSSTNNHGLIVINQNDGPAIDSLTFRSINTTSLSEFRIDEIAAATPEPAAWLMMIFGFGL
ncbi:MAG: hypothetical protein ABIQ66_05790, partial [Novosphingobium sp.]